MNAELWQKLEAFSFDAPGAAFPFSERLRRENGWTVDYTARVLEEYRRFLYLCVEAGHPVTPSDEVDQAWHLHLCYTRSYWEDLCGDTLGKPIHHGPTRGGGEEGDKFTDWYEATLATYAKHFGGKPPEEIWPGSERRFRRVDWVRVDRARSLVLSRKGLVAAISALGLALVTAGCNSILGVTDNFSGIIIFVAVTFVLLMIIAYFFGKNGGGKGGPGNSGCSGWWGGGSGGGCGNNDSGCGGSGCGGGGCGGD